MTVNEKTPLQPPSEKGAPEEYYLKNILSLRLILKNLIENSLSFEKMIKKQRLEVALLNAQSAEKINLASKIILSIKELEITLQLALLIAMRLKEDVWSDHSN